MIVKRFRQQSLFRFIYFFAGVTPPHGSGIKFADEKGAFLDAIRCFQIVPK